MLATNASGKVDRRRLATAPLASILEQKTTITALKPAFYLSNWLAIAYPQKTELEQSHYLLSDNFFILAKDLQHNNRINLHINNQLLFENVPNNLPDVFICVNFSELSSLYQQLFQLQNLLLSFTKNATTYNLIIPRSPYVGLIRGLLQSLGAEKNNFNARLVITAENTITLSFLDNIINLEKNNTYQYGEVGIAKLCNENIDVADCISGANVLRSNGVYVISGGLGGIGLAIADYIAQKVTCTLILLTRDNTQLTQQQQQKLQQLRNRNVVVDCYQAAITDENESMLLAAYIKQKYGLVNGIIHAAGCVNFGLIINKSQQDIRNVIDPKLLGTINLQNAFQEHPYDFFLLFSSTATESAPPGIGDYIMANTFLDEFSRYYNNQKPIKSIKWGMWREVGMSTPEKIANPSPEYLKHYQSFAMSPEEAISAFEKVLAINCPVVAITKEDLTPIHQQPRPGFEFDNEDVLAQIKDIWQKTLNTKVDSDTDFFEAGGHSLLALQLISRMAEEMKIKISLQDIFAYPTIRALLQQRF
jgi:short-subunit dehydrogenase/acyl carrier protein